MKGIYTTCVTKGALDESPFAYKPVDEIIANIEPTAEIVSRMKPIYHFKAGDKD
ncbi:MAG: RtcB family protein [Clostridia bacterium]|nr:RtcB family protein [Clostridia bacterium]